MLALVVHFIHLVIICLVIRNGICFVVFHEVMWYNIYGHWSIFIRGDLFYLTLT